MVPINRHFFRNLVPTRSVVTILALLDLRDSFACHSDPSPIDYEIDCSDVACLDERVSQVFDMTPHDLSGDAADLRDDDRMPMVLDRHDLGTDDDLFHEKMLGCELIHRVNLDLDDLSEPSSSDYDETGAYRLRFKELVLSGDSRPLVLISSVIHLALLLLLVFVSSATMSGFGGIADNAVLVRLLEREDIVPQDASPGSIDSAGSSAAIAHRHVDQLNKRDRERHQIEQQLRDDSYRELDNDQVRIEEKMDLERNNDSHLHAEIQNVSFAPRETKNNGKVDDWTIKDTTTVESISKHDSTPSSPSLASPERRAIASAGKDGEEFRLRIISAIYEAAYYPKKALWERLHGEAVVSFTVNRNGTLSDLALKKPSGWQVLDEAAIKIVQKASKKFPHIPDSLMADSISYEVPIIFKRKT